MKNQFVFGVLLYFVATLFYLQTSGQQTHITVDGWNAYVHLPSDYSSNPQKKYPTIIFIPGLGEVGSNASQVIQNGPGAYLSQGWNGEALGVKFIVISLQPTSAWPAVKGIKDRVDILKSQYRIGEYVMTGLSMGGWASLYYSYTYPNEIKTVVGVESVVPSEGDGTDYRQRIFDTYKTPALAGQRYLLFEQTKDWRRNDQVIEAMNHWNPGSGVYQSTSFGGGGHCCWNEFYGGQGKQPGKFNLDGIQQTLYEWIARRMTGATIAPPTASAGKNQSVQGTSAMLTGSASSGQGATISNTVWTKVSGGPATISKPNSLTTEITGLSDGTYVFKLTVTQSDGQKAESETNVQVSSPSQQPVSKQVLIDLGGWNAYVYLPDDYYSNPSKSYPTIIFQPGDGEVGSNAPDVLKYGPGSYIAQGWNGEALGVKFIVISIQPPHSWATAATLDGKIDLLKSKYRIGKYIMTGLSMGGRNSLQYSYNFPNKTVGVVGMTSVTPTVANDDYEAVFRDAARAGQKYVLFKQKNDWYGAEEIAIAMNKTVQGSAEFLVTDFGGGGHCCWNEYYGGQGKQPGIFNIGGHKQTVYEWMARLVLGEKSNIPPTATVGKDVVLTLPQSSTALTGSGTDPDGSIVSYKWTKKSGPSSYRFENASSANTNVFDLTEGIYEFELTVTDDKGATGSATMKVTVNPAANKPPVATVGKDVSITLPTNSATLSGSGSDEDGKIVSYKWTKKSGPSSYRFENASSANTNVFDLTEGVYEFELTVTDDKGATASATMKVTVNAKPNVPPVATVGKDVSITLPTNSATLSGSGSDEDGKIVSYKWTKKSGPSSFNIVNSNSAVTDVTNLTEGVYQFELTVTDDKGATASATMKVTVNAKPNVPPVATVGKDVSITLPTNSATLSGSGSDEDGKIVSYKWTKKSGPSSFNIVNSNSAVTDVTNLTEGVYQFELTVTDDKGATASATMKVTVNAKPNVPPVATVGKDVSITLPTNSATLSGSGSDEDGKIVSYKWTKKSGPSSFNIVNSNSAVTDVTNLTEGVYQFELTVTDDKGATASATMKVTVNPAANKPPVATVGKDVSITLPTNSATLSGSGSDDDGKIVSYKWTKKSGPSSFNIVNSNSAVTDVTNLTEGVYQFELTVTDDKGATASATMNVTVNAKPNVPPVATVGKDVSITLPTNSATLSGSGSDEDGKIVSYKWTKKSGPSSFNIVNSNSAVTDVTNLTEGVYQFELTVTDDKGATASATMKVTVNPAANKPPVATVGKDVSITLPTNSATLSGSGSDEDGKIVSYKWTKKSGPSSFNIVKSNSAVTEVRSLTEGVYQFELTVTDDKGATASATMKVTVNPAANVPPSANAGRDVTITLPTNSVQLTGSGSDPDGRIVSYQWTKSSGPSAYHIVQPTQAGTMVTGLVAGVYSFQLKVTDDKGASATASVKVTVVVGNKPPKANAGENVTITLPQTRASLTGSGTDEDGEIVRYRWTQISGPSQAVIQLPDSPVTPVEELMGGNYQFVLTVTDNMGASHSDTMRLTVTLPRLATFSSGVRVYPNPTTRVAVLEVIGEPSKERMVLSVSDVNGRVLSQKSFVTEGQKVYNEKVDLQHLKRGVYIITLRSMTGRVLISKRIIKE